MLIVRKHISCTNGKDENVWQKSFISGRGENVLPVNAIPVQDGKSAIFNVREMGGKSSTFSLKNELNGAGLKCTQVGATGTLVENGNLELKPFESKFFRVGFKEKLHWHFCVSISDIGQFSVKIR